MIHSERHCTPLDLETGSIVWSINLLRTYHWETKFGILSDHKPVEIIGKMVNNNARVQRWREFLNAFGYTLQSRKGSANNNVYVVPGLPEPATEHDRSRSTSLTPVEDGGIYLIEAC